MERKAWAESVFVMHEVQGRIAAGRRIYLGFRVYALFPRAAEAGGKPAIRIPHRIREFLENPFGVRIPQSNRAGCNEHQLRLAEAVEGAEGWLGRVFPILCGFPRSVRKFSDQPSTVELRG